MKRAKKSRTKKKQRRRLMMESLESRQLLAVDGIRIDLGGSGGTDLLGSTGGGSIHEGYLNGPIGQTLNTGNVAGQNNELPVAGPDNHTMGQNDPAVDFLFATLISNDSDPDSTNPLTLTGIDASDTLGHVTYDEANSKVIYDPNGQMNFVADGQIGTDTFRYTVSDAKGGIGTGTVTITINGVNDAPSFTQGADVTTDEDAGPQTVTHWATDITDGDSETDGLEFEIINNTNAGLFRVAPAIDAQGNLTFTSADHASGDADISVRIDDGQATDHLSSVQTFKITIQSVNDAPTFDLIATIDADIHDGAHTEHAVFINVASGPANESGQTVDIAITTNSNPDLFQVQPSLDGSGNLTFTPAMTGTATLTFEAVDDGGTDHGGVDRATKQLVITIHEVNRAPILDPIDVSSGDEGVQIAFTANAFDINDDSLIFSLVGAPDGATIGSGGDFSWTPSEAQGNGTFDFDVTVTDGEYTDSETLSVTIGETNETPILDAIGDQAIDEGQQLAFTVSATDADLPEDNLQFSLIGPVPQGAFITPAGDFFWTPTELQGPETYTLTIQVSDGSSIDQETFQVTVHEVNSDPVLAAIGNLTVNEKETLTFTATATDPDLPGNDLVFGLSGSVPFGASITTNGQFSWTPTELQGAGSYVFDVTVHDGTATISEEIIVTVNEVNDPPTFAISDADVVADLNDGEQMIVGFVHDIESGPADEPSQAVTFSITNNSNPEMFASGPTLDVDGKLTFAPAAVGSATVTLIATDDGRTDNGGADTSVPVQFTITISERNRAPQLDPIGDQTAAEGSLLTFTATAFDINGDDVTFGLLGEPDGATMTPAGHFTWTPSETQGSGTFTFDVTVDDGEFTDTQSVSISVDETNVAPLIDPVADRTVNENSPLSFSITATDADSPTQNLSYSFADGAPEGASLSPSGEFSWTPSELQGGRDYTFNVEVTDGQLTSSAAVLITVNEVNQAPILDPVGDNVTKEGQSLTFTATATDVDFPQDTITFRLSGDVPSDATITPDGVFEWTPTEDRFPGTYTFDVEVSDGVLIDSETIAITLETSMQTKYPIDGNVDFSGLQTRTESLDFEVSGSSSSVTIGFDNDDRNLYIALEWADSSFNNEWYVPQVSDDDEVVTEYDEVVLQIDGNGNNVIDPGEDYRWVRATNSGSFFRDSYFDGVREQDDIVGDGLAKIKYDSVSQKYQAEFMIPLSNDIRGQDSTITASSRFQFIVRDGFQPYERIFNQAIVFAASDLPLIPLKEPAAFYDHPEMPTDLTGLIVYVSTHEEPTGEIYTFDPATGETFRVTHNTLAENSVSLSRDRTKIAFHAFNDPNDIASLEIFSINVDGTQMQQLTDDSNTNAHPAWSPDGTKIIYSSIHPGLPGITVMSESGEFIQNLTPQGIEDHDADYLPDGRIVFKTNRWSTAPQYLTGVMNDDGTNVQQLTFTSNVSDHDQFGNDEAVIFERFPKGTDYEIDPEGLTLGWELVEAPLDGSGELTLLSDGWMNTTPVYDPSGRYILYMKGPAYFEASLMTREGKVLGRFIPDVTQIKFIDWR